MFGKGFTEKLKRSKILIIASVVTFVLVANVALPIASVDAFTFSKLFPASLFKSNIRYTYIDEMAYSNITTSQLITSTNETNPYDSGANIGGMIKFAVNSLHEWACISEPIAIDTSIPSEVSFRLLSSDSGADIRFGAFTIDNDPYNNNLGGWWLRSVNGGNYTVNNGDYDTVTSYSTTSYDNPIEYDSLWHDYALVSSGSENNAGTIKVYEDGRYVGLFPYSNYMVDGSEKPSVCIKSTNGNTINVTVDKITVAGYRDFQ